MNWTLWWVFVPTEAILCLTPGPAVLLVLSTALRLGGRRSIASNLGILAANAVYFALSATGVGALLVSSYSLFFLVKWIGAAYLVWLGLRSLLGKADALDTQAPLPTRRLFTQAFLVQASNPKAILFFTALLPQFIDPHFPVVPQVAILGATSAVIEFLILLGYGLTAGRASGLARQPKYARWTNRTSGVLLIGAGTALALIRR